MTCWFQSVMPHTCEWRADGQPDPVHLVPAQRVKRAGLARMAWDPRIIRPGCRHIHDRLDGRNAIQKFELAYDQYPDSVREWAQEANFYWANRRDGWREEYRGRKAA